MKIMVIDGNSILNRAFYGIRHAIYFCQFFYKNF